MKLNIRDLFFLEAIADNTMLNLNLEIYSFLNHMVSGQSTLQDFALPCIISDNNEVNSVSENTRFLISSDLYFL